MLLIRLFPSNELNFTIHTFFREIEKSVCLHQFSILGGAGGKGTWGKLGCELELPWIDPNDPNYESDSEKAESPKAINGKSNVDLKALVPEMSEEDVRKAVEPLILEYFENSDSMEVLFTLQEMLPNLGKCKNEIHIPNIQKPYF